MAGFEFFQPSRLDGDVGGSRLWHGGFPYVTTARRSVNPITRGRKLFCGAIDFSFL